MAERRPPSVAPQRPTSPQRSASPQGQAPSQRQAAAPTQAERQRHANAARVAAPQAPRAPARPTDRAAAWTRVSPPSAPVDTVTHRMQARLAERRRTERLRALSAWGRWFLVAGIAVAAVWAVLMAPVFSLDADKIELQGLTSEIDQAQVLDVLAQHDGDALVMLNTRGITSDLEQLQGVRDARVERVWPAGLRVTLVARHPVAAIADGATFVLLDADAIEVGTVDQPPVDLPLVDVPVGDDRILSAVLDVIRSLPADVLARVGAVGAQTEDSVSFTLRDGPRVEWGSAEDSALKAQVLTVMLATSGGAAVIDLSAPTLPITRSS